MLLKIKQLIGVVTFCLLASNAFAGLTADDLGPIKGPDMVLFHDIQKDIGVGYAGAWSFELLEDSWTTIEINSLTDTFGIFSPLKPLNPLDMVVDGQKNNSTSFFDLLTVGTHTFSVFGLPTIATPYIGVYGSVGVIPAVPEMSTFAMMFFGAGFVAFSARRKKQQC